MRSSGELHYFPLTRRHLAAGLYKSYYPDATTTPRADPAQNARSPPLLFQRWCSREDSNLHGLPHTVLSRARLPIPPHEHFLRGEILVSTALHCKCDFWKKQRVESSPALQRDMACRCEGRACDPSFLRQNNAWRAEARDYFCKATFTTTPTRCASASAHRGMACRS